MCTLPDAYTVLQNEDFICIFYTSDALCDNNDIIDFAF